MDRTLDPTARRRTMLRRGLLPVSALLAGALALWWGLGWLRPAVDRGRIRTAKAEMGPIEATITAAGLVVPEVEQVLSSPIDARVLRIPKRAGSAVAAGEAILELDTAPQRVVVERLRQQVALTANQRARTTLDLASRLNDLDSQRQNLVNLNVSRILERSSEIGVRKSFGAPTCSSRSKSSSRSSSWPRCSCWAPTTSASTEARWASPSTTSSAWRSTRRRIPCRRPWSRGRPRGIRCGSSMTPCASSPTSLPWRAGSRRPTFEASGSTTSISRAVASRSA